MSFFSKVIITELTYQFCFYTKDHFLDSVGDTVSDENIKNQSFFRKFFLNHINSIASGKNTLEKTEYDIKEDIFIFANALDQLHNKGIVHGRICPENLRINTHGSLKIQDIF